MKVTLKLEFEIPDSLCGVEEREDLAAILRQWRESAEDYLLGHFSDDSGVRCTDAQLDAPWPKVLR